MNARTTLCTLACAPLILAGCATDVTGLGGSSSHRCPMPDGGACMSMSEVYAESVGSGHRIGGPSPAAGSETPSAAVAPRTVVLAPGFGDGPFALRSPPRVMRIAIAPWRDSDDNLMELRRVYVQIDGGRWNHAHFDGGVRSGGYAPIRPPTSLPPAAQPEPSTRPNSFPSFDELGIAVPMQGEGE